MRAQLPTNPYGFDEQDDAAGALAILLILVIFAGLFALKACA